MLDPTTLVAVKVVLNRGAIRQRNIVYPCIAHCQANGTLEVIYSALQMAVTSAAAKQKFDQKALAEKS